MTVIMRRVLFDRDSGRLRLDPQPFDALLSWAEGHDVDHEDLPTLTDAGVVIGNHPHPAIGPAVEAIAHPVCLFTLQVTPMAEGASSTQGAGWMGEETAALALDAPDEMVELICLAPTFVPAALARVLGISPRASSRSEAIRLPRTQVDAFFAADLHHRSLAGETAPAIDLIFAAPGACGWELSVRWPDPAGTTHTRNLRVIDTPSGFWVVADDAAGYATLLPATPTTVWRLLLRQFPP